MLSFLKRPEVIYCLVVAAGSVVLFPLSGLLGAYYLFFFIFPVLLVSVLGVSIAAGVFGGPGLKGAAKWGWLTVAGLVLGVAAVMVVGLAPGWAERNLTWEDAYTYRFIIELDTADGIKRVDRLVPVERKAFSLRGEPTGGVGARDSRDMSSYFKVARGIDVGFPMHENRVFSSLYTDTLRRLNLPLDGDYAGRELEVDKELFPRITASHLAKYDPATLALYRDALRDGRYRILVELVGGTPQVSRPSDQVCRYLLTLEVDTPDGPRRAETMVRILRDVKTGGGREYVRVRSRSGFLRIPLADDLGIALRFAAEEPVTLPQRLLAAGDLNRLSEGDRVEVPRALIDAQPLGGPLLVGQGVARAIGKYPLLVAGKANYVLRLEMLDGTVTRNTDWNDPKWSPGGQGGGE
ncbi:hypothetical protein DND132_1931 [Pseudodesulfovibrio mercurii]|uniref:Uncharacterized protein n=1 Tax=Pseudodesulfovibrio mercurii TaxID=641491 RepID=F0JGU7_9BACT|nr:hypothetical protein [Pseudodesulfovibrio mercurii]EGB15137.1 hypothetical protein DND132_1931 [Pseudodesulfovibrio mercurii]